MFWNTLCPASSNLTALVEKEDVSLLDVIGDEFVIQELKCTNRNLIEFLQRPANLEELVTLALNERTDDETPTSKFRWAHIATEILTAEDEEISKSLVNNKEILQKLYIFVKPDKTLNPILCSNYCRIFIAHFMKSPESMIEMLNPQNNALELPYLYCLLAHISTSAIVDLIFRLVTAVEECPAICQLKKWLCELKFAHKLAKLISPKEAEEVNSNAAHLYCELVRYLRDAVYNKEDHLPDILLDELQSEEVLSALLSHMFDDGPVSEASITSGIEIFLCLLHWQTPAQNFSSLELQNIAAGTAQSEVYHPDPLHRTETVLLSRLDDFHNLLLNPPAINNDIKLPHLGAPLGLVRLCIAKLIAALLSSELKSVHEKLINLGTMGLLLKLFFTFHCNNFLHTTVVQCIISVLTGCQLPTQSLDNQATAHVMVTLSPLANNIFNEWKLANVLMQELGFSDKECIFDTNEKEKSFYGKVHQRNAYTGHLFKIASAMAHLYYLAGEHEPQKQKLASEFSPDNPELWDAFIDRAIHPYCKFNEPDEVGLHPSSSLKNIDRDAADVGQLATLGEAFALYQSQEMTQQLPEKIGFAPCEFIIEPDNPTLEYFRKSTGDQIELNLDAVQRVCEPECEKIFQAMCDEQIPQPLPFDSDSDDEWPTTELKPPATPAVNDSRQPSSQFNASNKLSSTSDDIFSPKCEPIEDDWADFEKFSCSESNSNPTSSDNWANFDAFSAAEDSLVSRPTLNQDAFPINAKE